MIWNPEFETLSRKETERLQAQRLARLVDALSLLFHYSGTKVI
jgi:hypothetical protein